VKVTARQMRKFGLRSVSLKFRFLQSVPLPQPGQGDRLTVAVSSLEPFAVTTKRMTTKVKAAVALLMCEPDRTNCSLRQHICSRPGAGIDAFLVVFQIVDAKYWPRVEYTRARPGR
jgi:hypothetical protein